MTQENERDIWKGYREAWRETRLMAAETLFFWAARLAPNNDDRGYYLKGCVLTYFQRAVEYARSQVDRAELARKVKTCINTKENRSQ